MSEKLKPCPFCGSRDVDVLDAGGYVEVLDACGDPYSFSLPYVHCNNCNADSKMCKSIDEAIAAWNRRADKVKVVAQVSLDEDKLRQLVDEAMKNVAVEYAQSVKDTQGTGVLRRARRAHARLRVQGARRRHEGGGR